MKNVIVRSISGLVYIALIVGTLLWGYVPFSVLAALFAILGATEFVHITNTPDKRFNILNFYNIICVVLLALGMVSDYMTIAIWLLLVICRFFIEVFRKELDPLAGMGKFLLAQFWIGIPLYLMTALASVSQGIVLAIFIMIWLNDTGAFVVGSTMGRHKLYERLSPKKTWEGFIGGVVFSAAFAVVGFYCWNRLFEFDTLTTALVLGIAVPLAATFGDLFESKIKRSLNIKDSGNIMPGHGGILDRIDSLLYVIPVCFIILFLFYTPPSTIVPDFPLEPLNTSLPGE